MAEGKGTERGGGGAGLGRAGAGGGGERVQRCVEVVMTCGGMEVEEPMWR